MRTYIYIYIHTYINRHAHLYSHPFIHFNVVKANILYHPAGSCTGRMESGIIPKWPYSRVVNYDNSARAFFRSQQPTTFTSSKIGTIHISQRYPGAWSLVELSMVYQWCYGYRQYRMNDQWKVWAPFVLTPSPKIWPGTSWNLKSGLTMGPSMSQLYHRIDDFTVPTAGSIFKRVGLFPQVKARGKWATMHHYALCVYPKHLQCDNDNSYGPLCPILRHSQKTGGMRIHSCEREGDPPLVRQLFGPENPSEFPLVCE